MIYIHTKDYEHYNRSMGKYIRSKAHYTEEMKKGGYITDEQAKEKSKKEKEKQRKPYEVSQKTLEIIKSAKATQDSNGKLHLGDKVVKEMIDMGAIVTKETEEAVKNIGEDKWG